MEHTPQALKLIQQRREATAALIPWSEEMLPPHYRGAGILNLPASVCAWLGVLPPFTHPPLDPALHPGLPERFHRVVLILVDGVGRWLLEQALAEGLLPFWERLSERGHFTTLTSVAPSTTATALTTLWTGRSPAEHGVLAYEIWLKEYGMVANMIFHTPAWFQGPPGTLEQTGFRPETFLPHSPLGSILSRQGIRVYALQPANIVRSGLSRMLLRDAEIVPFSSPADAWLTLARLLEEQPPEARAYYWLYWPAVDALEHHHGPHDPRVRAELQHFLQAMQSYFFDRLTPAQRRETLFIFTSDHGFVPTPPNPHYEVAHHPRLLHRLHLPPIGENRLIFLYPRPGRTRSLAAYFAETWPEDFLLITQEQALQAELFGPGRYHPNLRDRIGDWLALARHHAYLWWAPKQNHLLGRHGGLHRDEMLVPLLLLPLEAY